MTVKELVEKSVKRARCTYKDYWSMWGMEGDCGSLKELFVLWEKGGFKRRDRPVWVSPLFWKPYGVLVSEGCRRGGLRPRGVYERDGVFYVSLRFRGKHYRQPGSATREEAEIKSLRLQRSLGF